MVWRADPNLQLQGSMAILHGPYNERADFVNDICHWHATQ
jgi:hypothetical protein